MEEVVVAVAARPAAATAVRCGEARVEKELGMDLEVR
jgi:hypothetical protein